MKHRIRGLLLFCLMVWGLSAWAQQPAEQVDEASRAVARRLGYEGVEAYQKGDFRTAAEKLGRAYKILRAPSLGLWSARASEKNGQFVEASERYLEVKRLPVTTGADVAVQQRAQADAAKEYDALQPRIPQLEIQVTGATPEQIEVSIDGVKVASAMVGVPLPANPGNRKVEGKRGTELVAVPVALKEGEKKSITLRFGGAGAAGGKGKADGQNRGASAKAGSKSPSADRGAAGGSWQKTVGWAALGVGGAGLGVGAVAGGMAMGKKSELDKNCPNGQCEPAFYDDLDSYDALRTASTVGFIFGLLGTGAGITLILTAPKQQEQTPPATASLHPFVGVGSAGVVGTF